MRRESNVEADIQKCVSKFHPDANGRISLQDFSKTMDTIRSECESSCESKK